VDCELPWQVVGGVVGEEKVCKWSDRHLPPHRLAAE